jgi:hypothetical protein
MDSTDNGVPECEPRRLPLNDAHRSVKSVDAQASPDDRFAGCPVGLGNATGTTTATPADSPFFQMAARSALELSAALRGGGHVHRWRVQGGGAGITNSEAGMMFKVCRCGAVEQISWDEARRLSGRESRHP